MQATFPDAHYALLSSRLVPGTDGGFLVAVLARARQMAAAGVNAGRGPLLLTLDPASPADHAAHRETFVRQGLAASEDLFRNLFDEAIADPAWLRVAALPGAATADIEYRTITDAAGTPVLSLPVVPAADWLRTEANVVVHGAGGDRVLRGFRGLYRAWLDVVVARLRDRDRSLPVVVICESRQVGELLAGWHPAGVCLIHTIHTSHLDPAQLPAHSMNDLWTSWFGVIDAFDAFDAVLWPTRQQRDDVAAMFGARDTDAVVPNAVAPHPGALASPVPGRVVMVGRLAPGKRVDHTLRAWRQVVEAVPHAHLEIVGDGPLRDELSALVDEWGLTSSVTFRGHVERVLEVFDGAEVMVQSTAFEGQGLAALEAVSRGCPVVSYDVRYGPRDLLAAGGGILVPDGDVDALAAALVSVLTDPTLRERLSREAIARAAAYTPECAMAAMGDAVRRAIAHALACGSDRGGSCADEFVLPL